ncbi:MAG: hypothetical protein GXO82_04550, partial [Chlorobi bacterium]|nr:hypothetical protein [Chlorobiota bacterium]
MEITAKVMDSRLEVHNAQGRFRILVTKKLPGNRWIEILTGSGCRVDIGTSRETLTTGALKRCIGDSCHGVIGQLTEDWNEDLLETLKAA